MTRVDDLWFLATEAKQRAEQRYHDLCEGHTDYLEFSRHRRVSRRRFRRLAERVKQCGAPYGAHTLVHDGGRVLLVRHDGVDLWVLPGGEVARGETFREAAERELREEAGVGAAYAGLAMANRVTLRHGEYTTWGVLPVFEADATETTLGVDDPDDEISAARWFPVDALPSDTRDRGDILAWAERTL